MGPPLEWPQDKKFTVIMTQSAIHALTRNLKMKNFNVFSGNFFTGCAGSIFIQFLKKLAPKKMQLLTLLVEFTMMIPSIIILNQMVSLSSLEFLSRYLGSIFKLTGNLCRVSIIWLPVHWRRCPAIMLNGRETMSLVI